MWLDIPPVPESLRDLPVRKVGKMKMQTEAQEKSRRASQARVMKPVSYRKQKFSCVREAARVTGYSTFLITSRANESKGGWAWI